MTIDSAIINSCSVDGSNNLVWGYTCLRGYAPIKFDNGVVKGCVACSGA